MASGIAGKGMAGDPKIYVLFHAWEFFYRALQRFNNRPPSSTRRQLLSLLGGSPNTTGNSLWHSFAGSIYFLLLDRLIEQAPSLYACTWFCPGLVG